jgi:hypothetical protein
LAAVRSRWRRSIIAISLIFPFLFIATSFA